MISRPTTALISQMVSKYPDPPLPAREQTAQDALGSTVTNAWLLRAVTSLLGLLPLSRAEPTHPLSPTALLENVVIHLLTSVS